MYIRSFLVNALIIQLLMSIASLPFLLWWHMPYPLLSIIGNLVHPIFLSAFLFISSSLFCALLLGLPHQLLTKLLILTTNTWDHLLDTPIPSGWIPLHWWYLIPALSIALAIIGLLLRPGRWRQNKRIIVSLALLNSITGLWHMHAADGPPLTILHKGEHAVVFIPQQDQSLEIIDQGYIGSARDTKAVLIYDIMPHILFTYGMPSKIQISGSGKRVANAQIMIKKMQAYTPKFLVAL